MGGADHCPFVLNLVDAAEKELSEVSGLLDMSEDGFNDAFSHSVSTLMPTLPKSGPHELHQFTTLLATTGAA